MSPLAYFTRVAIATILLFVIVSLRDARLAYSIRELLRIERAHLATANSFYSIRVAPILEEHCVSCHGSRRQKGKLRLDSFQEVVRGGKHGAIVQAGSSKKSELFARIVLPVDNEKVMPPDSKPRLTSDDVTVIRLWIEAGASGTQAATAIKDAPPLVAEIKFPVVNEIVVKRQRASLAAIAGRLGSRFPNLLSYDSRASADFQVNASGRGATFGDRELLTLAPLADRIVWMDLSGTSITDASADLIKSMRHLRTLRLSNTRITDALVRGLSENSELRILVVLGTSATDTALAPLRKRGVRVYGGSGSQR